MVFDFGPQPEKLGPKVEIVGDSDGENDANDDGGLSRASFPESWDSADESDVGNDDGSDHQETDFRTAIIGVGTDRAEVIREIAESKAEAADTDIMNFLSEDSSEIDDSGSPSENLDIDMDTSASSDNGQDPKG